MKGVSADDQLPRQHPSQDDARVRPEDFRSSDVGVVSQLYKLLERKRFVKLGVRVYGLRQFQRSPRQ